MAEYDVAIIGAGPGGYVAAIRAAQLGGEVALIEEREMGGTCLNRGCIPTKALLASVELLLGLKRAEEFGMKVEGATFDLKRMLERKNAVVEKLRKGVEFLLGKRKVDVVQGRGRIVSPQQIEISRDGGRSLVKASNIIIATGSEPALIPVFNIDRVNVLTSDEALELTEVPQSLLIVGSGAIGAEFACIFNALGTKVIVVEMLPQVLPTEDAEVGRRLEIEFKKRKIEVLTGERVESVTVERGGVRTTLSSGRTYETEKVLVAIGRSLNTRDLGLEKLGVETERGRILVNHRMETNVKGVYAVGDVTGGIMLAHVASKEGIVAAQNCMGKDSTMDYDVVPRCIYTFPEVACVGLRENEARERGYKIKVGRFPFAASGKALCMGEETGFVKMVVEEETNRVLGVHMIGCRVTDLVGEVTLAMDHGLTADQIADTIHAHPSLTECIMEASEAVSSMAIHMV